MRLRSIVRINANPSRSFICNRFVPCRSCRSLHGYVEWQLPRCFECLKNYFTRIVLDNVTININLLTNKLFMHFSVSCWNLFWLKPLWNQHFDVSHFQTLVAFTLKNVPNNSNNLEILWPCWILYLRFIFCLEKCLPWIQKIGWPINLTLVLWQVKLVTSTWLKIEFSFLK